MTSKQPSDLNPLANRVVSCYHDRYGAPPEVLIAAPGRVNLIGEHTDYNEGFVLPTAINRHVVIAASPRPDNRVVVHSLDFDAETTFSLDHITHDEVQPWSNYERGVAWVLLQEGYTLRGLNAVIAGDVPIGAGLSSSAAVEVATAHTFRILGDLSLEDVRLALLCQRAENEFVGMNCGIMDQFIITMGKEQHALFIDCRDLSYRLVPIPEGANIIISNSRVHRDLVASAYNERRGQCEEGARLLGVQALRDIDVPTFEARAGELPEPVRRRCKHVIYENQRVLDAVMALEHGDLNAFGQLMNRSHISLRDDYEVSCRELDILVEAAWQVEGVFGSRMTGAGFGGCTVSLVQPEAVEKFIQHVASVYQRETGITPEIYPCRAEDGVRVL